MKTLYFDCFAGISGDMTLGALIGVGADAAKLREALSSLGVDGYKIDVTDKIVGPFAATDVDVVLDHHEHHHHHRHLGNILEIISNSDLSDWVKATSSKIFTRLAEAEATVHGTTVEHVHFHEVGAVDAIVDIVGSVVCLDLLGRPTIVASPIPTFHGYAKGSHGTFPLPAPATVQLLKGIPWRTLGIEGELVTPTGAAIITTLASEFGPMPAMTISKVGYGAGKRDYGIANVLRVMYGETAATLPASERVSVIETNIDDLNPQLYDSVMQRLFAAGALDVYMSPIQMKKNRPGTLFSVLCNPGKEQTMAEIVLSETSALGVRIHQVERVCLDRRWEEVKTEFGAIRIKIGHLDGKTLNAAPEYEDCRLASEESKAPLKHVYDAAIAAYVAKKS